MQVKPLLPGHWEQVKAIYLEGIATGLATFQTEAPTWADWDGAHHQHSRLVVEAKGNVCGWAALSPVSARPVYAGVAEVTLYIGAAHRNQGIGTLLLQELIEHSEKNGIWTLQSVIFQENAPSLNLHRKCGFREVGIREKIGCLRGAWIDTVLFERRSRLNGV